MDSPMRGHAQLCCGTLALIPRLVCRRSWSDRGECLTRAQYPAQMMKTLGGNRPGMGARCLGVRAWQV
eukprot:7970633-Pyramimonas_sp.AAC.1